MKIKHISFDFWNTICKSRKKDQNFNLEDLFFNFSDKTKEKTQSIGFSPIDCFIERISTVEKLYDRWKQMH